MKTVKTPKNSWSSGGSSGEIQIPPDIKTSGVKTSGG